MTLPGEEWREQRACAGETALFFPDPRLTITRRNEIEAQAKAICARCPVAGPCAAYAFERRIKDGVWGGLDERQRKRMMKSYNREREAS